jgi:hypothetical protein
MHHVFGCRHLPATEDAVAQSDAQNGGCIDNDMTQRRYKTDSGQGTPCGPSDRQRTLGLRNRVFERGEVVLVLPTFCSEASAWDGEFEAKLIPATMSMQPNARLAPNSPGLLARIAIVHSLDCSVHVSPGMPGNVRVSREQCWFRIFPRPVVYRQLFLRLSTYR